IAAPRLRVVGPGDVQRRSSAAFDDRDGGAVDLDFTRPDGPSARLDAPRLATGQGPAPQRAGHDETAPADREDPVDRQPRRSLDPAGGGPGAGGRGGRPGRRPPPPPPPPTP